MEERIEYKQERIKNRIKKIISILLVIIWMIIVFWFSSQVGDDSSNMSGNTLRKIFIFFNSNISSLELERLVDMFQPIIRKLAHYLMYTIGGILIFNACSYINQSKKKKIMYAITIGVLYAISDEIHQIFVPGRSGRVLDVIIDSTGVLTGIFLCDIFKKIKLRLFHDEK